MRKLHLLGLCALCVLTLGALAVRGAAQIKRYTLPEMVAEADGAVYGEIVARRAFRVDDPEGLGDLYFTTLTVAGRSLYDESPLTVDVTFHGGFVSEEEGVHNSEAPAEDDVRIGNRIVAFYAWADDMGGGLAANSLLAAHGGLYRTVDGPAATVVLGRGEGYAIDANLKLADLDVAVDRLK